MYLIKLVFAIGWGMIALGFILIPAARRVRENSIEGRMPAWHAFLLTIGPAAVMLSLAAYIVIDDQYKYWSREHPVVLIRGNQIVYLDGVKLKAITLKEAPNDTYGKVVESRVFGRLDFVVPDDRGIGNSQYLLLLKRNPQTEKLYLERVTKERTKTN